MIEFVLNDQIVKTHLPTGSLLLDYIRIEKSLKGTKIGCREGDCGACTVLVGELQEDQVYYRQVTSCLMPLANVHGKHIVTIEGLNMKELSPVQKFMVEESGTQCGFCTSGFIVSFSGYCINSRSLDEQEMRASIDGNICRCTGYKSIERAGQRLVRALSERDHDNLTQWLIDRNFIPPYFSRIPGLLNSIEPVVFFAGTGPAAGGGTDLYVQQPHELIDKDIYPFGSDPKLKYIRAKNGRCHLGSAITMGHLTESQILCDAFPNLVSHIKLISSSPVRNMSTLAGNFINASPIGDMTIFFLALNATLQLTENGISRALQLKDFYKDYKQLDKTTDEILTEISFELPTRNTLFNFEKVSKRTHLDIATVNTAIQISEEDGMIRDIHLSAGGVGPTPKYLSRTCDFLKGKLVTDETIRNAASVIQEEIKPISDVRGSADYKRLLMRQLFFAHFVRLFPDQITIKSLLA